MKLYLITQRERTGYDTYDSAVVCAESELDARNTHAHGIPSETYNPWESDMWASSPDNVTAELIGEASPSVEKGIVLASFNAG